MKKLFIAAFSLILLLNAMPLFADGIAISASVDKNSISLDDQIVLELTVSGNMANLPNPTIPDMGNFTVYSSGRSQSMSIMNGQMSSSIIYRYTLAPKNTGKYTIQPITLEKDGKTYRTEPIQVEVLPAGKAPKQAQASGSGNSGVQATDAGRNLFITAGVDKSTAYVSEQVNYTFKFYRRIRLLANPQYTPANFSGFWTEDTAPKSYYSTINGIQYLVTEVKTLLFPTKSGRFDLGAGALQCSVEDFSQNEAGDAFFSSFFSGGKTQVVHTNPVTINVLPLPENGKPAGFSGAVGQFKISASLDKKFVRANEPVTLSLTISGTGNIKTVPDPVLPDWQDFKKYETVNSLNINKDGDILKGSKEFKTIIVPLTAGQKNIRPIAFSYFDPQLRAYRTVSTPDMPLDVKPAAAGQSVSAAMLGIKNDIHVMQSDIRYIKSLNSWKASGGILYEKPWFIAVNVFPLCLLGVFLGYVKWQEKLSGDVAFARRLRASSTAKKYLKKAKAMLASNASPADYYNAISRALLEFIANKTNVSADGLVTVSISEILLSKKVEADTISKVSKILDECNLVRFAPTSVTPEMMRAIFEEAGDVIGRLEKEMR